jgi:uncharacterized membrane protein YvbJ
MAETIVENQVCSACGAGVREGALFCYHCGGAVASEIAVAKNEENETIGKTQFQKTSSKENENGTYLKQSKVVQKQAIKETFVEEAIAKPITKPILHREPELKSAAEVRGKSKGIQPKKIEIIWEEHENTPNVWFILTAVALTILALVILFLAIRLK